MQFTDVYNLIFHKIRIQRSLAAMSEVSNVYPLLFGLADLQHLTMEKEAIPDNSKPIDKPNPIAVERTQLVYTLM